jgi:hypothetical protein
MQAVCSVLGLFEESAVLHALQSVHSHTKSIHDLHFKVPSFVHRIAATEKLTILPIGSRFQLLKLHI